jgi:RNA-directed DNA polymerase
MEGALEPESVSTKQERIAELARRNPSMALTSLNHYLDMDWLYRAYDLTRKDGAVGVDQQSAAEYATNLEERMGDLLERLKSGRYQAPAVRRHYIPKGDGSLRPLGIPTFEDKVAQRAIVMLLDPIYEQTFYHCSYGFRVGRNAHQALWNLRKRIMEERGKWILDVDLRKYFDSIDHTKLRILIAKRVTDGVVRKLIDKWLSAGVLEDGQLSRPRTGTPQGGVISPLLANIFLHYALDDWFVRTVRPHLVSPASLTRYADDFVMVFANDTDAHRVWNALPKRLHRFGLELHPEKSRLVDFRFQRPRVEGTHADVATTFDFLGFTHLWTTSRRQKNVVLQRTAKGRLARTLKAISDRCKHMRHDALRDQHDRLVRALRGHYAYFAITGNSRSLRLVHYRTERIWHKWLCRRSRRSAIPWRNFQEVLRILPIPTPVIVHRYVASEPMA